MDNKYISGQFDKKDNDEVISLENAGSFLDSLSKELAELKQTHNNLEFPANVASEATAEATKQKKEMNCHISEDGMEGWLYLPKPEDGSKYTRDQILDFLANNGIKTGYVMSNILAMVKKGVYERAIKVAVGMNPTEGEDGYYEYFFDYDALRLREPSINPDGSVDYTSMNLMCNVAANELLMKYHVKKDGQPGYTVTGEPIEAQPVKDLPIYKGKGFKYDPKTFEFYSETEGKLTFRDMYEIEICKTFQVSGDVTQINGNIDFYGDIEITGNVESGTRIRSAKSITISGTVEACEIYAGGDIIFKKGIQGGSKAKVICGGTVYANFIEHSSVFAKGDIKSNTIINSELSAEGKIILTGKHGSIIGGYAHGRKGIEAVHIGNEAEMKTVVHVGLENKDYLRNQDIMKRSENIREGIQDVITKMTELLAQKNIRPLTKVDIDNLNELNARKKQLVEDLKDVQFEEEQINKIIMEATGSEIKVTEHIYKGTIVCIDSQRKVIPNSTSYTIYSNQGGIIEGTVFNI